MCMSSPKAPAAPPPPPPPIPAAPLLPADNAEDVKDGVRKVGKKKLQIPLSGTEGGSGLGIPV